MNTFVMDTNLLSNPWSFLKIICGDALGRTWWSPARDWLDENGVWYHYEFRLVRVEEDVRYHTYLLHIPNNAHAVLFRMTFPEIPPFNE